MKLTLKIVLVISLFCSTALADGDIKHGQRDDDSSGGGLACAECLVDNENEIKIEDSILTTIRQFFRGIFDIQ